MAEIITLITAVLAIIFGIIVLIKPKILSYLVALWFILYGILTLISAYLNLSF